ncbi:hypothetical protein D6C98_10637 [Aureobasidium pullulans]|nr:hypothetical protein D6C98_10637 [Aureobasidium pullulans]
MENTSQFVSMAWLETIPSIIPGTTQYQTISSSSVNPSNPYQITVKQPLVFLTYDPNNEFAVGTSQNSAD